MINLIAEGAVAIRKRCEPFPFWWRQYGLVLRADKKGEVVFSGLFFFGSFLLEEQKK
jgi:hypothetical protein